MSTLFYAFVAAWLTVFLVTIGLLGAMSLKLVICPTDELFFRNKNAYKKLFKFKDWYKNMWSRIRRLECTLT